MQMRVTKSLYLLEEPLRFFSTIEMLCSTQVLFMYQRSGKFNKGCTDVLYFYSKKNASESKHEYSIILQLETMVKASVL